MVEEQVFTCKECGSHGVLVTQRYEETTVCANKLLCGCGKTDLAAFYRTHTTTTYWASGILDHTHNFEVHERREVDEYTEDEEINVGCQACYDSVDPLRWEQEYEPVDQSGANTEIYMHCEGCGRAVDFHRSHDDAGYPHGGAGRIWPHN